MRLAKGSEEPEIGTGRDAEMGKRKSRMPAAAPMNGEPFSREQLVARHARRVNSLDCDSRVFDDHWIEVAAAEITLRRNFAPDEHGVSDSRQLVGGHRQIVVAGIT